MADLSQENKVILHVDAETKAAEQSLDKLRKQDGTITVDADTAPVQQAASAVEKILNDTERSAKSKVMALAQVYKAQGMEMSEAMAKAWDQVRDPSKKLEKPLQKTGTLAEKVRDYFRRLGMSAKSAAEQAASGMQKAEQSTSSLHTAVKQFAGTLGSVFAVGQVIAWGKACVSSSNDTENALRGLSSILNGQGRSFSDAQGFINDYIADGLVPLSNAVTAYKNLAARGYDDTQIQSVLTALKDSAAYGRQASYSLGDAVTSATEGLKNENSILVDNAGVTKNVAKMWDEYAKSIGTTSNNLTQAQKIQAEVNGILTEARFQTGDAAKVAETFSGQTAKLSASLTALKSAVGSIITGALSPLVGWLNRGVQAATVFAERIAGMLGFSLDIPGTDALGDSLSTAVGNTEELTTALDAAQKAEEQLGAASFDDFNIIGSADTTTGSTASAGSAADVPTADSSLVITPVMDTAPIVQEAESTVSRIEKIFDGLLEALSPVQRAWETYGDDIEGHLASNFDNIKQHVLNCVSETATWAKGLDYAPLMQSIDDVLAALAPLSDDLGGGLEWLWTNVLLPLGGWTIEEAAPRVLGVLSEVLRDLDIAVKAVQPKAQWLWDELLNPLARWTGDIITDGLDNLKDWLHDLGDWVEAHPDAAVKIAGVTGAFLLLKSVVTGGTIAGMAGSIASFIGTLASLDVTVGVIIAGIVSWGYVITELSDNWEDICDVFIDSGGQFGFLVGWLEYVCEELEFASADVEAFFSSCDFGKGWLDFWEGVGEAIYDGIHWWGETFTNFGEFLYDLIHGKIPGTFQYAWNFITALFSDIGPWFKERFQEAYNGILKPFERIGEWAFDRVDELKTAFSVAGPYFKEQFETARNNVTEAFQNIGNWFSDRWTDICAAFSDAGTFFSDVWNRMTAPFRSAADWFRNTFSEAWDAVLNVFNSGGTVFQGIQAGIDSVFRNVVNGLIDGINAVLRTPFETINSALWTIRNWGIWLPWAGDWFPFEWLPEVSMPEIPRLAKGGLAYQPTLAMIGDNANAQNDPEIISPLSKLKAMLPESSTDLSIIEAKLDTMIQLMQLLIDIVSEIDPCVTIGDKDIYAASERGRRKFQKMKGVL